MTKNIKIHEVGLRDGLQNESKIVPTEKKIEWIDKIIKSNVDIIQLGSFVHPVKMPQMADTDALFEHYKNSKQNTILSGLILNEKGMERGLNCGVEMFCMGVSASNTHSKKNTGMETMEALERIIKIAQELQSIGKKVQVSVQSAFGCGFEGKIEEKFVLEIAKKYIDNGIMNISLADTSGHAYPEQVQRLFAGIKSINEDATLTAHFHNTYGLGLTNCYYAMKEGAEYLETAFGGLGGCPFTKLAAGNVSTEDLVHSLNRNNIRRDINIDIIAEITNEAEKIFDRKMQSYVVSAGQLKY